MITVFMRKINNSATLMTWLNLFSKTVGLALLLPLVLSKLPQNDIVLWYVFTTMVGIGLLFDLGFSPTFIRFVAYSKNSGNISKLFGFNNNVVALREDKEALDYFPVIIEIMNKNYLVLSLIVFFTMSTAGSLFVYKPIMQSSNVYGGWISWFFVVFTTSMLLYGNKYVAILHGLGSIADNQKKMALCSIFATIFTSLALLFNFELPLIVVLYQGITSISVLLNRKLVINKLGDSLYLYDMDVINDSLKSSISKKVFSSSWRSAVGIFSSVGIVNLSGIGAANFLSQADAATYLLSIQLIRAVTTFAQAPFYTKLPMLAGLYSNSNFKKLKEISHSAELSCLFVFVVLCLSGTVMLPFGEKIFNFSAKLPEPIYWGLLSVGMLIERIGAIHIQIYSLTNKIIWHIVNGVTGLIMVFSFFLLIQAYDILAFPLSIIISYLCFYYPVSSFFAAKLVGGEYVITHTKYVVVSSIIIISIAYVIRNFV